CAGAVGAPAARAADDAKKLEGTWVVESSSRDKELANPWKGGRCVFGGGSATLSLPGEKDQKFTFPVDSTMKPKTMDFVSKAPQFRWLMIYELNGDSLKFCMGDGDRRPTEFSNKQGLVVILKRKK